MLLTLHNLTDEDIPKLMAIYAEGNRENADYFYPDLDPEEGERLVVVDFVKFLRTEFFPRPGNTCYVLEEEGRWVSALRVSETEDGLYLEALETHPDLRRQGCAARLLTQALELWRTQGVPAVRDSISCRNAASLATHKKCGFVVERKTAVNPLTGEENEGCCGMVCRLR